VIVVRGDNGADYEVHADGDDVRVYRAGRQVFLGRLTRDRMVGFVAGRQLPSDVMEQVVAVLIPPALNDDDAEK
jgi:hypothetical protein